MNFTEILDFNTASTNQASYSSIPANTCVKACFTIRNGHCAEDPCLSRSPNTGALYLDGEFTEKLQNHAILKCELRSKIGRGRPLSRFHENIVIHEINPRAVSD